jgi:hypothetical protein
MSCVFVPLATFNDRDGGVEGTSLLEFVVRNFRRTQTFIVCKKERIDVSISGATHNQWHQRQVTLILGSSAIFCLLSLVFLPACVSLIFLPTRYLLKHCQGLARERFFN